MSDMTAEITILPSLNNIRYLQTYHIVCTRIMPRYNKHNCLNRNIIFPCRKDYLKEPNGIFLPNEKRVSFCNQHNINLTHKTISVNHLVLPGNISLETDSAAKI